MITKEEKEEIVKVLIEKLPHMECPMCHNRHFIIADGYTMLGVQDVKDQVILGGQSMPVIGLACSQCGFISFHSLGILGLLEQQTGNGNNG